MGVSKVIAAREGSWEFIPVSRLFNSVSGPFHTYTDDTESVVFNLAVCSDVKNKANLKQKKKKKVERWRAENNGICARLDLRKNIRYGLHKKKKYHVSSLLMLNLM